MTPTSTNTTYSPVRFGVLGSLLVYAATGLAQQPQQPQQQDRQQTDGSPNPYAREDDSWIAINGTVVSVAPNTFVLDYGGGQIVVEMDDRDRDAEAYPLIAGDDVTVSGRIDEDFFGGTSIEATAVYIEKIGSYFYARSTDEETASFQAPMNVGDGEHSTAVTGTVTDVSATSFTLSSGGRSVTVEVDGLADNPLDAAGYPRIQVGDLVTASGQIDPDFFARRVLEAESVVTIYNHPG